MLKKKSTITIAICLFLVIFVLLIPFFLSMPWVVKAKLADLDPDLAERGKIGSCSLGWLRGLHCRELSYENPEWNIRLEAAGLHNNKGLFALLFGSSYLGDLHIEQPVLTLFRAPEAGLAKRAVEELSPDEMEKRRKTAPWWERLSFAFTVQEGRILLARDDGSAAFALLDHVEIQDGLLALGRVQYDGSFRAGLDPQSSILARGFVNLPTATQSAFEDLISQSELEARNVEIAPYVSLLGKDRSVSRGRGKLAGRYLIETVGFNNVSIEGEGVLRDLSLVGTTAILPDDIPFELRKASFQFKSAYKGASDWQLSSFSLDSEPLQLEASGHHHARIVYLDVRGAAHAAKLAALLPSPLDASWKELMRDEQARFTLNINSERKDWLIKCEAQSESLSRSGDQSLFSDHKPFSLRAEIQGREGMIVVPEAQFTGPFFALQGKGDMEDFSLRASADIASALTELRLPLPAGLRAQGQMELDAQAKRLDDSGYQMQARMRFDDFALLRDGISFLGPHDSSLAMEGFLPSFSFSDKGSLGTIRLAGNLQLGSFLLESDQLALDSESPWMPWRLKLLLDMTHLDHLLLGLQLKDPDLYQMKGLLSAEGDGLLSADLIALFNFAGKVEQPAFKFGKMIWQEPELRFSLSGKTPKTEENGLRIDAIQGQPSWQELFMLSGIAQEPPLSTEAEQAPLEEPGPSDTLGTFLISDLLVHESWGDFASGREVAFFFDPSLRILKFRNLHLATPQLSVDGNFSLTGSSLRELTADFRADAEATFLARMLKNANWLDPDVDLNGQVRAHWQAKPERQKGGRSDFSLHIEPFTILDNEREIFADSGVSLEGSLTYDPRKIGMRIDSLHFLSTPLAFEATGLLSDDDAATFITLQGNMRPDLDFFTGLLPEPLNHVRLTQGADAPFLFGGPLGNLNHLRRLSLSTTLPLAFLRYQNIELRDLTMPLDLTRGKLSFKINTPFQGGALTLAASSQLDEARPHLTIFPGSVVLREVELSPTLLKDLLQPLHPLFGILARPKGKFSLQVEKFSWPLGDFKRKDSGLTVAVDTVGLKWQPIGVLDELFTLLALDKEGLRLENRRFACESGPKGMQCGNIKMRVGDELLSMRGATSAEGKLSYKLNVPVTKHLTDKLKLPYIPDLAMVASIGGSNGQPLLYRQLMIDELTAYLYAQTGRGAPAGLVLSKERQAAREAPAPAGEKKPAPAQAAAQSDEKSGKAGIATPAESQQPALPTPQPLSPLPETFLPIPDQPFLSVPNATSSVGSASARGER